MHGISLEAEGWAGRRSDLSRTTKPSSRQPSGGGARTLRLHRRGYPISKTETPIAARRSRVNHGSAVERWCRPSFATQKATPGRRTAIGFLGRWRPGIVRPDLGRQITTKSSAERLFGAFPSVANSVASARLPLSASKNRSAVAWS